MFDNLLNKIKNFDFFSLNWKAFFMSLISIFAMVLIQLSFKYLEIKVPRFFNLSQIKMTSSNLDILNNVRSKLEQKPNNFKIKKETSLLPHTLAAEPFDNAKAYLVVDFDTGQVLAEKNSSEKLPIASLTKVMTAVTSLDLTNPSDMFTVTQTASNEIPTKIGVVPGQRMSLEELLNASLLTSANDAAEVIREGVNQEYNDDIFTQAMNVKANYLGLNNTHFDNPQGLDSPQNYSSAEDLAVLSHYALTNYPLISQIAKKDYQFLPANSNHKQFDLYNWNGLLGVYPNVSGLKIGNTDDAGYTTIVLSERQGKRILVVLLGAPGVVERDLWASQLLDLGFQESMNLQPASITANQLQAKYDTWQYWN